MEAEVSKAAVTPMSSVPTGQRLGEVARDDTRSGSALSMAAVLALLSAALLMAILVSASLGAVKIRFAH